MRARFLLPALWLLMLMLPMPRLRAQGRPQARHWRTGVKRIKIGGVTRDVGEIGGGWGTANTDTTTHFITEEAVVPVRWDVSPDSIRLFLNCENPLIAPTRPRNGQLPIHFTATGATVRLDAPSKRLFITPSMPAVILWAFRGKTLVFKHIFKVIPPPLPHIECFIGGGRASSSRHPEKFTAHIKAVPQSEFSSLMPDDAKYRVSQYQLTLLRNNVPLGLTKVIGSLNLTNQVPLDSAQSGDKLRVNVQQVQRQNFRGVIEDIPYIKYFTVELL